MHSLVMACVGLAPRPIPEPGLENAGVVGRAVVRISGTMPRRRVCTGNSYSPHRAAMLCYRLQLGVEPDESPPDATRKRTSATIVEPTDEVDRYRRNRSVDTIKRAVNVRSSVLSIAGPARNIRGGYIRII